MSEWEESEQTDEEKLMDMLEILQKENEDLKQRLHHQPQPQNMEPLLQTIRQQEAEITRLNSSLLEERSQNERLLELAQNEKQINAENLKLNEKIQNLELMLKQRNTQLQKLSTQVEDFENKFKNLPSKSSIDNFSESYNKAIRSMKGLWIVNIINWGIVGVFGLLIVLNGFILWRTYNNSKDTLTTSRAVENAVYAPEGYSVLQGSKSFIQWSQQQAQSQK